ncbi:malonate--CoA ligase [Sneathiella litorea]|uniref:3-methylmercaptopropionyl-CoA ligase n=1 Tax=Sneathiella litorea TaxID=2606216 RepID=A0A6L8WBB5_9PROT|nr:malonyl-CoA synthase [Sneathiella litorea]MZR31752.1 AMP-binding protein [Sneathiella litorea]
MTNKNLYSLFENRFPANMDEIAFEGPDIRSYSFKDISDGAARIANLLTQTGAVPGDRVAVQVEKSVEAVILYLACLRAGLAYLPLNTAYKSAEIEYFITDSEPAIVVCAPADLTEISAITSKAGGKKVFTLDATGNGSLMEEATAHSNNFETIERTGDDLAAILYTSGTTGRSKGAMLTHENLGSNGKTLKNYWQFQSTDVLLHSLPIFHVHGLFVALHCALLSGAKIIFLKKFDPAQVLENLPKSTVFMGVPTLYVRLLNEPGFTKDVCRNMRLFTAGSAPLLTETFNAFRDRTGHAILERYGMTEAGMITSNPYEGERKAGTVGFPLDNEVRITDDDGNVVKDGDIGILEIKGPNVFKGYWRMPEKTAAEFRADGYFITGDMTQKGEDGYYRIVGRSKDLIISGGYNVYPKEIESFIDEMPGVEESAVVGRPHPDFGEAVVAFVVPDDSAQKLTEQDVIAYIKEKLANFKVPKQVFIVDSLPRNTMGKVQKNQLRDRAAAGQ